MEEENTFLFEIVKIHDFSWSYVYIINGKKRDIYGDSLGDLKRKVLEKGFPWDDENYPEEMITESKYDPENFPKSEREWHYKKSDITCEYEESIVLKKWCPSNKKRNRYWDIN